MFLNCLGLFPVRSGRHLYLGLANDGGDSTMAQLDGTDAGFQVPRSGGTRLARSGAVAVVNVPQLGTTKTPQNG